MRLSQASRFAESMRKQGYKSDGCTFAPDLWIKPCCEVHDFLLHFKQCSRWRADWIYFLLMVRRVFPFAPIYYAAVTVTSVYYTVRDK